MVLARKTNLFVGPRKRWFRNGNQKPKITVFGTLYGQSPKRLLFCFPWDQSWFEAENRLATRKKDGFCMANKLFLAKNGFGPKYQGFSWQKR